MLTEIEEKLIASGVILEEISSFRRDIAAELVGTWDLAWNHSNVMLDVAETMIFREDGTGQLALGALRENFTWWIEDDTYLVVSQMDGVLIIAYTINSLSEISLSYQADVPGIGFFHVGFTRRR